MKVFNFTKPPYDDALLLVPRGPKEYVFQHHGVVLALVKLETVIEMLQRGHAVELPTFDCGDETGDDATSELSIHAAGIFLHRCEYIISTQGIELITETNRSEDVLFFYSANSPPLHVAA